MLLDPSASSPADAALADAVPADAVLADDPAPDRPADPAPLSPAELGELTRRYAEELTAGPPSWQFDADSRWHRRIHRDDQVDVWLISWLPTQGTQLHDHGGSSGAFTVIDGVLDEAQISGASGSNTGAGVVLHERDRVAGSTVMFGPQYVHDVRNTSVRPAVSVHAYSPPLTLMRYYDVIDGGLRQIGALDTDDPEQPFEQEQRAVDLGVDDPAAADADAEHGARYATVDDLLADARSRIDRLDPAGAAAGVAAGDGLVDIRPHWQREREGEIPGALIVERNHLEWRLHPASPDRLSGARPGRRWIVVCSEGYTSSLAADSLIALGIPAADVVGGFHAWRAAGLPTSATATPVEQVVPIHRGRVLAAAGAGGFARTVHA